MANKPGKSWNEIQMAITAIAITGTLGFWNLFATPEKAQAAAKVVETAAPPPPPTETMAVEPTATALSLRPVKIIYGGTAPKLQVVQVASGGAAVTSKKHSGGGGGGSAAAVSGGGGGGGAPVPAPKPPPSTGSSKP